MYYYSNKIPKINDTVIVKIVGYPVKGESITCQLIEYDNIEGIILRTEITKKKEIEPKKIFKINEFYAVNVISIDNTIVNNTKIDLSYLTVSNENKIIELENFKYKNNILNFSIEMSQICNLNIELILQYSMWKFMDNPKITSNLKEFYNELLEFPNNFSYYFPDELKNNCIDYITNLKSRITSTTESASKYFTFIVYKGLPELSNLDSLKWCLTNNINFDEYNCSISFISPSKYTINANSMTKGSCSKNIDEIVSLILENSKKLICKIEFDTDIKIVNKVFTLKKYFITS